MVNRSVKGAKVLDYFSLMSSLQQDMCHLCHSHFPPMVPQKVHLSASPVQLVAGY